MKSDIQIAQEATMKPITEVAESLGITFDELELYGKYKAKISDEYLNRIKDRPNGKLVLVTAINPTPAGEGKTTTTVGLGQAFAKLKKECNHRTSRALFGTLLRYQGRCRRRRICTGCSDGRFKPSLHR